MDFEEIPSKIFHPLLILPLAGLAILVLQGLRPVESLKWVILWVLTAMIPTSAVAWNTGEKGFDVISREERNLSYAVGLGSLLVALLIARSLSAPSTVVELGYFAIGVSLLFALLNRFTKISIHTGSLTFVAGGFVTLMPSVSALGLLMSIPVGWSRVRLDCHTKAQVIQGVAVGFSCGVIASVL